MAPLYADISAGAFADFIAVIGSITSPRPTPSDDHVAARCGTPRASRQRGQQTPAAQGGSVYARRGSQPVCRHVAVYARRQRASVTASASASSQQAGAARSHLQQRHMRVATNKRCARRGMVLNRNLPARAACGSKCRWCSRPHADAPHARRAAMLMPAQRHGACST